jgi:hypothetical protein
MIHLRWIRRGSRPRASRRNTRRALLLYGGARGRLAARLKRRNRRAVVQPARDVADDPVEPRDEVVPGDGGAGHDPPRVALDPVEVERLRACQRRASQYGAPGMAHLADLCGALRAPDVLLIREHEERCASKALERCGINMMLGRGRRGYTHVLVQQPMQLVPAIAHAHAVARVDDPHNRVRLLEVVPPVRAQRALAADVPCRRTRWSAPGRREGGRRTVTHRCSACTCNAGKAFSEEGEMS